MLLLAALGATIIGFVLLIVALVTANWWFAIACVAVSVVGVLLLLGDVLTYHRGDRDGNPDEEEPVVSEAADDADTAADGAEDRGAAPAGAADLGAAREAGTVGHEEFGHHEEPAPDSGHDSTPTSQFPLVKSGPGQDWSHESAADTDQPDTDQPDTDQTGADQPGADQPEADDRATGLIFPGRYDPDMTDQIPQVEIERAWGAEWEPPDAPDEKQRPDKK